MRPVNLELKSGLRLGIIEERVDLSVHLLCDLARRVSMDVVHKHFPIVVACTSTLEGKVALQSGTYRRTLSPIIPKEIA